MLSIIMIFFQSVFPHLSDLLKYRKYRKKSIEQNSKRIVLYSFL